MTLLQQTLTRKQLEKLSEEATALAEWTAVRDFAHQMYGTNVAKISIGTYGEYDDEGGTDYHIEDITAYDKEGNELEFDRTLPFFASKTWSTLCEDDEVEDDDDIFDKLKYADCSDIDDEDKDKDFVLISDLPTDHAAYNLTTIPTFTAALIN